MAYYAALTSLSQTLEQNLERYVHQQIASLHDKVSRLLLMLGDLSQKSSLMIRDLEGKIRDASYEAENIIESNISGKSLISPLQNMIPAIHPRQMVVDPEFHGLDNIIEEFESILVDLSNKINEGRVDDLQPGRGEDPRPRNVEDPQPKNVEDLQPRNSTSSSRFPATNESHPVGLDVDLLRLKDQLTEGPSRLTIISIVGMGGIGKTTLASNLYNDSLVKQHFDIRAWIVVSQEYDLQEMLMGLLDSNKHEGGELHKKCTEDLKKDLRESLSNKRYLIVFDDVWDTNFWNEVSRIPPDDKNGSPIIAFPDDKNGSQIIITTRRSDMAISERKYSRYNHNTSLLNPEERRYSRYNHHMSLLNPEERRYSTYNHHMSLLNQEESWNLLRKKVFGNECCSSALGNIGKRTAKNCKGLPLTIVMIGGLLYDGTSH